MEALKSPSTLSPVGPSRRLLKSPSTLNHVGPPGRLRGSAVVTVPRCLRLDAFLAYALWVCLGRLRGYLGAYALMLSRRGSALGVDVLVGRILPRSCGSHPCGTHHGIQGAAGGRESGSHPVACLWVASLWVASLWVASAAIHPLLGHIHPLLGHPSASGSHPGSRPSGYGAGYTHQSHRVKTDRVDQSQTLQLEGSHGPHLAARERVHTVHTAGHTLQRVRVCTQLNPKP